MFAQSSVKAPSLGSYHYATTNYYYWMGARHSPSMAYTLTVSLRNWSTLLLLEEDWLGVGKSGVVAESTDSPVTAPVWVVLRSIPGFLAVAELVEVVG